MTYKQLKWFHFKNEESEGYVKLNVFLANNKTIDVQCTNNGYGSHVYVIYMGEKQ